MDKMRVAMIDAAMVEMKNLYPPLSRTECARLIDAAWEAAQSRTETFECCGCPVVGNEYMGQVQMVCCGKLEPAGVPQPAAVPVVGEPVAWENFPGYLIDHQEGSMVTEENLQFWLSAFIKDAGYNKPTTSITAAELATLREKAAMADELRKALLALKEDCQTSNDCQYGTLSTSHVARIVDAAIAQGKGE